MAAYQSAERGEVPVVKTGPVRAPSSSLAWLLDQYQNSIAWQELAPGTRASRKATLARVKEGAGTAPYAAITRQTVQQGMDRRAATPHGANNFLKAMKGLFRWAAERGFVETDPTIGVRKARVKGGGFKPWTPEDCAAFEARWQMGTPERLAYDLLCYTGLRRGDVVRIGRQHIKDGILRLGTSKTGVGIAIPIVPPLAASIIATPSKGLFLIETQKGLPRSKEGFGNWFGAACRVAGVDRRAHGLRKAAAIRAAGNGATDAQLEAWFAWTGGRMAAFYRSEANRETMAQSMAGMIEGRKENVYSRTVKKVRDLKGKAQ